MSQFIEMFENVESYCKLEDLISDTFSGEWGSEPISENAIKVIRTTNFTNEGYLDLTDVVTRDIEPKKVVRKKLKQGDTILERSGGTKDNPVGRVVFFDEIGDYLPNNFTQVLRPKESVNPVYLFYALYNSYNLNKAAMRAMASQTTGIQNLSMSDFMAKSIVLPSRDEQNKFEQIYRQADKSKFGDFKSQFIEMFGGESNKVPFEEIVVVKDDCRRPINEGVRSEMKDGELYPYYGATGVVDYINDYLTDDELLCIAEDCGNYNAGEESAYIIRGKAWVNNHAHLVKTKEACDVKYLYYFLKIADLKPYVSGTTRLKLTQKKLKKISVTLPSTDKQKTFVKIAEQADKSKSVIQKALVYLNDIQSDELGKIA